MLLLFMLGSTLSISISPILAASDIDNDGILDELDSCPRLQEDYFGDIDGCPSENVTWNDFDYDAIPDDVDECITLQENYNGFEDEDGCPDNISTELIKILYNTSDINDLSIENIDRIKNIGVEINK